VDRFNAATSAGIEIFAPTFVEMVHKNGKVKMLERPLLFHYVFANGDMASVKSLCRHVGGFSFVMNPDGEERYATISDASMEAFKTIARFYGNRLPCFVADRVEFEEGDVVQIVSGDFAGLTGTYVSRKGASRGNILVAVTQKLAAVVYDIPAEYVRVLKFAHNSKRVYDHIDACVGRLLPALRVYHSGGRLSARTVEQLTVFCRRFGTVKLDNNKVEAKLQMLLMAANILLGDMQGYREAEARFGRVATAITNRRTLALKCLLQGVTGRDAAMLRMAREYAGDCDAVTETSSAARRLREEIDYYLSAV